MNQAWELSLPPTPKLVLLALCDWSNDQGICFPGVRAIATKTSITERHCQRVLRHITKIGLVSVVGNHNGGGGSRRYQINVAALAAWGAKVEGDKLSPVTSRSSAGATNAPRRGDTDVTRTKSIHQIEPPREDDSSDQHLDLSLMPLLTDAEKVVVVSQMIGLETPVQQQLVDELAGAIRSGALKGPWPSWFRAVVKNARNASFSPNHAIKIQAERSRRRRESEEAAERRERRNRSETPESRAKALQALRKAQSVLYSPPE